ncbi:uncharacterized protein PAC_04062 [Phialocephala subalpina]|uniref:2EXR domain-containing protein n=1 Tax=Phialocephala subalpina TaxID=576137 RepID=A0A1L7WN23_9HELO|nr:uncharacterized protein PAC_04062 [Phialocephala subalpina]
MPFPQFLQLPEELRHRIWNVPMKKRRIVTIDYYPKKKASILMRTFLNSIFVKAYPPAPLHQPLKGPLALEHISRKTKSELRGFLELFGLPKSGTKSKQIAGSRRAWKLAKVSLQDSEAYCVREKLRHS